MKKSIIIPALATLAVLASSCSKDFLSPEPSEFMSKEQRDEKAKDPGIRDKFSAASLQSTYNVFSDTYAPGTTTGHDNFGLTAHHLALDLMGEDALMKKRTHFIFDYELGNYNSAYRRTQNVWRTFYKVISDANIVINDYYKSEDGDAAYKAQRSAPLTLRGVSYFYLVNFYQLTYKGHEDALGVPLVIEPTEEKFPRATVREVYQQIVKDLTYAAEYGAETPVQTDVDKFVAAAYLAKVYAQMEDWTNVAKYAAIAKRGGEDIVSIPGRSWELGAADILWGADKNAVNTGLYASLYSQIDPVQYGYARNGGHKYIHNLLYDQLPEKDSRRKLFVNKAQHEDVYNAFKDKAAGLEDYSQLKFINTPAGNTGDYCFLRVQDPILLEIEALNELGQTAEAARLLTDFVTKRNPDFVAPTDQEGLRAEIRFQRRVELWLEGTALLDRRRWGMDIKRNIPEGNHSVKGDYSVTDMKFIHQLPQRELDSNSKLVQN